MSFSDYIVLLLTYLSATHNRQTEANLAENGLGRSAPAQFLAGDGKAAHFG